MIRLLCFVAWSGVVFGALCLLALIIGPGKGRRPQLGDDEFIDIEPPTKQ